MQLSEDIAQLLKSGQEQIAFSRLEQLYKDENTISVYELDLPNDINEAISTLIFASARCGDLPELSLIRKLFGQRYGRKFATTAVEFQPGNLVNFQVKDKLTPQTIPETLKSRLLNQIVRDYFFKSGPLALEYKPDFYAQPPRVTESSEIITDNRDVDEVESFIQLTPLHDYKTDSVTKRTGRQQNSDDGYLSESSTPYPEDQSVICLDDVEEFKSPTIQTMKCLDQYQRCFVFKSPLWETKRHGYEEKFVRRESVSMEKNTINDAHYSTDYSNNPHRQTKFQNKNQTDERIYSLDKSRHLCSLDRPCYSYTNYDADDCNVYMEEIKEIGMTSPFSHAKRTESMGSPSSRKCQLPPPYTRAVTMPQRMEMQVHSKEIHRSYSLPVDKIPSDLNGAGSLVSPPHVHPKLPDYDEIAAKFRELKKVHQQQNKCNY
ncbi:hypothetical protein Cgig2_011132 [Carnegiea gigantea]|uniref:Regulator of Vps4 activity in the MVB pathway protein n=1 Tax=Carnegiea gigantea TaxID=171969 RepID=A0A9Q1JES3_9CARY|nr:hypothetical protein Cgig2_011132 [Carnegiea gigantea]